MDSKFFRTGPATLAPNGYLYFYCPEHPLSYDNGMVYLHRHEASLKAGRWLTQEEHVHHIDGDKLNNSLSNLKILKSCEHGKIHHGVDKTKTCKFCGKDFQRVRKEQKFCDCRCANRWIAKNRKPRTRSSIG